MWMLLRWSFDVGRARSLTWVPEELEGEGKHLRKAFEHLEEVRLEEVRRQLGWAYCKVH